MIKILRIINRLNVGGPIYNVAYLSKYLSDNFETIILSGQKEPFEASSEYILKSLDLEPIFIDKMYRKISFLNDFRAYWQIRNYIREFKPDIVHTHAAKAGMLGRLAAYHENVPVIVHTFHGNVFDGYFGAFKSFIIKSIEKYLARISTCIIAISKKQKDDLIGKYKITYSDKVKVIPLGFDLSQFKLDDKKSRDLFRSEMKLDDDCIGVGIIGRLTEIKNHKLFIDSFLHVKLNSSRKLKAFVVGDGELRDQLVQYSTSIGLLVSDMNSYNKNADIVFTSWRRDINVINAGIDVLCLTSINEGTPVCLIEGIASGKIIITTKVGGVEDFIAEPQNGFLAELDLENFATKLLYVISNYNNLKWDKLQNRIDILNKFSHTRLVNDIEQLYLTLV